MSGVRKPAAGKSSATKLPKNTDCFHDGINPHLQRFQGRLTFGYLSHRASAFCRLAHTFLNPSEASRCAVLLLPNRQDAQL